MNDLERKLLELLEGKQPEENVGEQQEVVTGFFETPNHFALNDNASLARALGADTLNGNQF